MYFTPSVEKLFGKRNCLNLKQFREICRTIITEINIRKTGTNDMISFFGFKLEYYGAEPIIFI